MAIEESEDRLRELVLYLCQKSSLDPKFGVTKLNKLLFYCDFISHRVLGAPITGATYRKLPYGPVPARIEKLSKSWTASGIFAKQFQRLMSGKTQLKPVNLRAPNLRIFTPEQIALADQVIEALRPLDTEAITNISHEEIGWIAAREGEPIPYSTVYLSRRKPTQYDHARALELTTPK